MNLPPLPDPDMRHERAYDDPTWEWSYSAEAVRGYATLAMRTRARNSRWTTWLVFSAIGGVSFLFGWTEGKTLFAGLLFGGACLAAHWLGECLA